MSEQPNKPEISDEIKKLIREEVKKAVQTEWDKFFRDLNNKLSGNRYY